MSLKKCERILSICSALVASANYNAERRAIKYEKAPLTKTKAEPNKKAKRKAKQKAQRINRGK